MQFTASTISGSNRGKSLGFPTINLNLDDVPEHLEYGIFAIRVAIETKNHRSASSSRPRGKPINEKLSAVAHFGPRPVFKDDTAFEVHILDAEVSEAPSELTVEIVEKIRDIESFDSADDLKAQISKDCEKARSALSNL